MKKVSILSVSSVSPLGAGREEVLQAYHDPAHRLVYDDDYWVGKLPSATQEQLESIRSGSNHYRNLDPSVIMAIKAGRQVINEANNAGKRDFGINVGSSRGATSLFETYHREFLEKGRASTQASPASTLGNISSWLAHDLGSTGPDISHSITCSTALHAVLNGLAWIGSGMSDTFLVGGAEAPLTEFTLAQMHALKIYSRAGEQVEFPCRSLATDKNGNSMVLGEGAAMALLQGGVQANARALIVGAGYATEPLEHSVSLSADAQCFQRSMRMALGDMAPEEVDAIILHAPGTRKGDSSEIAAIEKVFGDQEPFLTTNKWKTGHTFGASGMLNLEMAVLMMEEQQVFPHPFRKGSSPKRLNRVLVNAVGFGGNAVSILLERPGLNC